MKVIIAGSRNITGMRFLTEALRGLDWDITEIISGGARGADTLGEKYAREHKIKLTRQLPQWKVHGKGAGFIRNAEMAEMADGLIALWDGESRGTKHMIDTARKKGLEVLIHTVR